MLIGYARVSTKDQETHLQLDALRRSGVTVIYEEKASSVSARPELQRCLKALGPGDVLMVYKLDRVARSLKDLLGIIERIQEVGASIRSITEPLDTTGPIGLFMIQVLGAVAQLERGIIRERAIAGQVAAIERGVTWGGRRPALDDAQRVEVERLRRDGMTQAEVAKRLGVSRSTISRIDTPPKPRSTPRRPVLSQYLKRGRAG